MFLLFIEKKSQTVYPGQIEMSIQRPNWPYSFPLSNPYILCGLVPCLKQTKKIVIISSR